MKFKSIKTLALVSSAIMGVFLAPMTGNAADNADVTVDIETQAGITATLTRDMDFGDWVIGVAAADSGGVTITMAASDGLYSTNEGTASDLVEVTDDTNGTTGQITVTLPTGANGITVQMSRGAISQFGDTNLSLGTITYDNADDNTQNGTLPEATNRPITVDVGATGALVSFGATITATATPADNADHTASFNVAFAY